MNLFCLVFILQYLYNMKQLKTINLFIILLLLTVHSKAQYNFRTIDLRSGLSDNFVRTILKDQQGFMWFGTQNGLTRYDGFRNRPYPLTQKDGKANNNILLVQQDKSGQMWVTTYDGHIFCYNTATDRMEDKGIEHLANLGIKTRKTQQGQNADNGRKLYIDQDKNLWCIQGKSIFYYLFDAHRLYQMTIPETVSMITCRSGMGFALSGKGNIYRINPLQKSHYLIVSYPAKAKELNIYQDTRNTIWIYDKYANGLYKKTLKNDKLEKVNDENICAMSEDHQGNLWLGTNSNGIIILHRDGTTTQITRNESVPYPLTSNHINTIEIDEDNMAWIGTSKLGIAYTYLNNTNISILPTPFNEDIGFLCQDAAGKLWIGFDGKGLYDVGTHKHYNESNSPLATNTIIGGRMANDGCMYLGTYGGGICRLNGNHQITRLWQEHPQLNYARRIIQDKRGNFWIGATMNGLCCISKDGKFHNYSYQNSALRTNAITDMVYSEREDLLLVATGTGLYTINGKLQIKEVADKALHNATVNVICIDDRGLRWVCTNEEMRIYDSHFQLLKTLDKAEGLNNVLAMTSDQQGQIWLTTSDAIYTFIVEKNDKNKYAFHFRKFINTDGLGDITFCKKAIFCTKDGDILAGGSGKYVRLIPSLIDDGAKFKKVTFTELRIGEEVIPFSTSSQQPLEFKYGEDFSLHVSTLDFTHAAHTQFAYQLDDDDKWIPADGNRIPLYNLSFGTHTVRVKALDGSEDTTASIQFTVRPPFWLSGYALCIYFILLIIILGIGYRHHKKNAVSTSSEPSVISTNTEIHGGEVNLTEITSINASQEFIDKATQIIEEHIDATDFSVEALSEEMNLSRSALYKKLMTATGKSPLEFMRTIRLRHGLARVQQGKLSVSEIAYSVGLSPKQFSKFFKEEYGVLPSLYKKQNTINP